MSEPKAPAPAPSEDEHDNPSATPTATPGAESGPFSAAEEAGDDATEARIAELEAELRCKHEDLLRERAEVENFKKRMQREKAEALRYALEPILRDLLPIADNLERAAAHAQSDSVAEGLQLVIKTFHEVLERHGVERIEALGAPFDPEVHEAISQADDAATAPGAVVEQHQVGYRLHSRLLRPALVTVNARKPAAPVEAAPDRD